MIVFIKVPLGEATQVRKLAEQQKLRPVQKSIKIIKNAQLSSNSVFVPLECQQESDLTTFLQALARLRESHVEDSVEVIRSSDTTNQPHSILFTFQNKDLRHRSLSAQTSGADRTDMATPSSALDNAPKTGGSNTNCQSPESLMAVVQSQMELSEKEIQAFPKKWERVGDVYIFQQFPLILQAKQHQILKLFHKELVYRSTKNKLTPQTKGINQKKANQDLNNNSNNLNNRNLNNNNLNNNNLNNHNSNNNNLNNNNLNNNSNNNNLNNHNSNNNNLNNNNLNNNSNNNSNNNLNQDKNPEFAIFVDPEGIKGELRKPSTKIVVHKGSCPAQAKEDEPCECGVTTHIENGIKYRLDASKLMFASGNGTERMHFAQICPTNELIVDMFAGIGYFSLPLAMHSKNCTLVAIEKNEVSFHFLQQNLRLNKIQAQVVPLLGDNRSVGNEYCGKAHRISMGYIPTPKGFLARALDFLDRKRGGLVHYHYTAPKAQATALPLSHFQTELEAWSKARSCPFPALKLQTTRKVKSYAPKLYHYVADVYISFPN